MQKSNQDILHSLDAQRFDAPILAVLREVMAKLGAPGADSTRLDEPNQDGFDAQTRGAFALCKPLRATPAQAAVLLSAELGLRLGALGSCEPSPGTGFVNIRYSDAWILKRARETASVFPDASGLRALIDYSSPNCAKRMHVGHLRSTVIGDAIRGILSSCGADVEIVNHLGDWGTPFGVIIEQARDESAKISELDLEAIEGIYRRGQARFASAEGKAAPNEDASDFEVRRQDGTLFSQRARAATASMQRREGEPYLAWSAIRERTVDELQKTYDLLGVALRPEHAIGESRYQDLAGPAISELLAKGIAVSSDGGAAFLGGKSPLPLKKSATAGGGFLYGGTDVAALKLRAQSGRWLLYVTDERQAAHFQALFELGTQAGWTAPGQAVHVAFGMMLDASGSPFKSRSGGAMPLSELVGEAMDAARSAILERVPDAAPEEVESFARPIGIGALKYGDLSRSRTSSVKFDIKTAARLDGDTAPYLQYARSRAVSAVERALDLPKTLRAELPLAPQERALALALGRMRDAAVEAAQSLEPHRLCRAARQAASAFGSFYESCPCVQDGSADPLRLELMASYAARSGQALIPLGIEALDSMPRTVVRPSHL